MTDINEIINERQKTHGQWADNARVMQFFKRVTRIELQRRNITLSNVQHEGLDMITHKIARILTGNPDEPDHWCGISGYATLVMNDLVAKKFSRLFNPDTVTTEAVVDVDKALDNLKDELSVDDDDGNTPVGIIGGVR